jgi:PPK2 family polyphosphate:nucleotide phosphotransferase
MNHKKLRYRASGKLEDYPTRIKTTNGALERLAEQVERIRAHQEVLFADGRHALLLVFQGMDCSGKDSTIKHVMSGVNPQGVHVSNFKEPNRNELAHSYLWRYWRRLPRRGMIGVFNRSHYEEVVVIRVHPEYLQERYMPTPEKIDDAFWQSRLDDLVGFEDHLTKNGIRIVKFLLHVSKEEQKNRLLSRIDRPEKNWKFDHLDLVNRKLWPEYQEAYQTAIAATHTEDRPWYIIPADDKPTMRALVAEVVADALESMPIAIPRLSDEEAAALQNARAELAAS